MRNVELLQKTMQYIKDHPEDHKQWTVWDTCGTPGCFMGWAQCLSGMTFQDYINIPQDSIDWAQEHLGLTEHEANLIFYPCNTARMLELMIKDLVNGDEMRLLEDYQGEARL